MGNKLDQIKQPIKEELDRFEVHFRKSMKSNVPLLDKITYYIVQRKGKQMRPMFVFLSAGICGTINETTYVGASMVELLHTATLVHDDVVDDAYQRRGFFSVNALWKNKIAVLVGDYLLSQGLLVALKNKEFRQLEILSDAVKDMAEGELLQIEKARRLDIDEAIYYEIIRQKTASLIAAACSAGAASVVTDEAIIGKIKLFGEKAGIAFQIKDDLFDFGTDSVGKPLGIDIKEKKMTLPLIFALSQSDRKTKKHIISLIKNESENPEKVREVIRFVNESGGINYATGIMNKYKQEAFDILAEFSDSAYKTSMQQLIEYTVNRTR